MRSWIEWAECPIVASSSSFEWASRPALSMSMSNTWTSSVGSSFCTSWRSSRRSDHAHRHIWGCLPYQWVTHASDCCAVLCCVSAVLCCFFFFPSMEVGLPSCTKLGLPVCSARELRNPLHSMLAAMQLALM